ncbi:MAG TPA: hypothetical protein VGK73_10370, partial [Polyangiaceae bacterium]
APAARERGPAPRAEAAPAPRAEARAEAPAPRAEAPAPRAEAPAPRPLTAVPRAEPPAPRPSAPAPAPSTISPDTDITAWRAIVESFVSERPELGAFLARAVPLAVGPSGIVIGFGDGEPFVGEVEREIALVSAAASRHFGTTTGVRVERNTVNGATLASLDAEEEERRRRAALAKVKNHPRVAEAVEVLGARVKELKLAER